KLLEKRGQELGQSFPLIIFHDIGWPYGRRDLYYDPATIPPAFLQPYDCKGLQPGCDGLRESGGINYNICHARQAGGPRNGVLTAIEDFHKEAAETLDWIVIPGFNGLGILFPRQLCQDNRDLADFLRSLELPVALREHFVRVEDARVRLQFDLSEARASLSRQQTDGGA